MIVMLFLSPSCSGKKEKLGAAILERDSLPGMRTLHVNTLISDSGIIRYRLEAEEWEIYDKKRPSYWAFEKGVYLEQFDTLQHVEAIIKADTAYYYDSQKLWELRGNVFIRNQKGENFNTERLYWDQRKEKVYSNRFIRIQQAENIITGYGFESNQQFTRYVIRNSGGIFPVKPDEQDSTRTDSIKQ